MIKKSAKKVSPKPAKKKAVAGSPLTAEQALRDITRIIDSKDFANTDEINAFLATLIGSDLKQELRNTAALSASEEAQELAYGAMEATTEAQARKLAKRALAKDPDCVDGLIVLTSMDATTPKLAIEGLQKAVAAGERSLGAQFFKENKGDFWGVIETRPYMRARQQLAEAYEAAGLYQDAIAHYAAMLDLNPNDNQGIREPLLGLYLLTGDTTGAARLLKRYKNDASATFAWGRVLERLLSDDLDGAATALKIAQKANDFVGLYMSAQLPLPEQVPEYYQMGSPEEAILSLDNLAAAWTAHHEAMFWLLSQLLGDKPQPQPARLSSSRKKNLIQ